MGFYRLLSVFLFVAIAAVSNVYSGIITNKIKAKKSYVYNCQERVITKDPCEKVTCPDGPTGAARRVYQECQMPAKCPATHNNTSATCCPIKCVCGDGHRMYSPGDSFVFSTGAGKHWACECEKNSVPKCEEFCPVPPKKPSRPPPTFPPFPPFPGGFLSDNEKEKK